MGMRVWMEGTGVVGRLVCCWGKQRTSPTSAGRAPSRVLPGREEKEMRAGWSKNDFGLGCTKLHAMGLESLPHPQALGQNNFCQAD